MQELTTKCAVAWRNAYAYTHDGELDVADTHNQEVRRIITENEEVLKVYLKPYIDLDEEKRKGWASGNENDRRQVASLLIVFEKEKQNEKDKIS